MLAELRISRGRRTAGLALAVCAALALASCLERKTDDKRSKAGSETAPSMAPANPPKAGAIPLKAPQLPKREPKGMVQPGARINVRLATEPRHLCPILAGDAVATEITLGDVYETLLQIAKPGSEATPHLATSISESDDHHSWTIKLRPGVRFQDGSSFDAEDVAASLRMAREAPGPLRGDFDDV